MKNSSVASASIKQELKKSFPGITFSVKSPHYGTVNVSWENGPTTGDVTALVGKYEEGSFNGMIDLYEYDRDRPKTNGSAKYVFCNRSTSDLEYTAMVKDLCLLTGTEYNSEEWRINLVGFNDAATSVVNKILSKSRIPTGHEIVGLERTECSCGLIEEPYNIRTKEVTHG